VQDFVADELWTGWPACTTHGTGLFPELGEGAPAWFCRRHNYVAAPIGRLTGTAGRG
jgi:hypothetical protein